MTGGGSSEHDALQCQQPAILGTLFVPRKGTSRPKCGSSGGENACYEAAVRTGFIMERDSLDAHAAPSFRDDAVRPFHERDKDCRIAEFCAPLGEVGVSYSTGAGARATSKNLNLLRRNFLQRFLERWPADRDDGLG